MGNRGRKENTERRDGWNREDNELDWKADGKAVLPPYTKCDSVTASGSANQFSPVFRLTLCTCAHRSRDSEGQRGGHEDRRAVRQRGGHRPQRGPDRHSGPHPAGRGQWPSKTHRKKNVTAARHETRHKTVARNTSSVMIILCCVNTCIHSNCLKNATKVIRKQGIKNSLNFLLFQNL